MRPLLGPAYHARARFARQNIRDLSGPGLLGARAFDHADSRRSWHYSRQLESRRVIERTKLGLRPLPASRTHQHVDVVRSRATAHIGLIDTRRIHAFDDQQLAVRP